MRCLLTLTLLVAGVLPATGQIVSVPLAGTTDQPTEAILPGFGSTPATCAAAPTGPEPYQIHSLVVAAAGVSAYSFAITERVDPPGPPDVDDTVLTLYEGSFDPSATCANFLAVGNETPGAGLDINLAAGTYVLVVSGYLGSRDPYVVTVTGPQISVGGACDGLSGPLFTGEVIREGGRTLVEASSDADLAAVEFYSTSNLAIGTPELPDATALATPADYTRAGDVYSFVASTKAVRFPISALDPTDNRVAFYIKIDDVCGRTVDVDPQLTLTHTAAETLPDRFVLRANYPNPFNPETRIRFELPESVDVQLAVFDLMGREVAQLVEGVLPAGAHEVVWSGRDAAGHVVASGTYLYRLQAGSYTATRRMTVLK